MCRIVRNDEVVAPSSPTMGGDQLPVEDRIRMRTKIFSATTREVIVASWVPPGGSLSELMASGLGVDFPDLLCT